MDLILIVYIIEQIFILFALNKFMKVFFEKRKTSFFMYTLTYLFFLFITSFAFLALNIPLLNLSCNIVAIFFISLNFESSIKRKVEAVCFIYVFLMVTKLLTTSSIMNYFFNSLITESNHDVVLGYITSGLLFYLEAILSQNLKNVRKNNPVSNVFWISSFIIPVASIFISIVILSSKNISQIVLVSSIIIIFLINILTFYIHDSLSAAYIEKMKSKLNEREKEYCYNQCKLMGETTEELIAFKQNMKNLLSTLGDYINQNQWDDASGYLSKLMEEVDNIINYSNTGNIAFDSIINYKLRKAKKNNVDIQINVTVPQKLKVDVTDIVLIIGNLLDNAMTAVLKTEERKIYLNIEYKKGRILIFLENIYNGTVKCKNGEVVSGKVDGKHGYGLKKIRKILEKYNGCMDITHTESLFSTDILIYVQAEE